MHSYLKFIGIFKDVIHNKYYRSIINAQLNIILIHMKNYTNKPASTTQQTYMSVKQTYNKKLSI